jgi:hypothetical protein
METVLKYAVVCYMLVESEEDDLYDNLNDAVECKQSCQLMQPENIYKIVPVEVTL